MTTLKVDDKRRVRLPGSQPGQVYVCEHQGNGNVVLTLMKAKAREPFPRGSLKKYITPEMNREQLALLKGCSLEVE